MIKQKKHLTFIGEENKKSIYYTHPGIWNIIKEIEVSEQLLIIANIDKIIPENNIQRYMMFLLNHNFMNISKKNLISAQIYDESFQSSHIIIHQQNNILGLLTMAHELGHAFFRTFVNKTLTEIDISIEINEFFAFINEFLVLFYIFKLDNYQCHIKGIQNHIYKSFVQNLSLDLFEKEIMNLEFNNKLKWNAIVDKRNKINKILFKNKEILNQKYSEYNILLNEDFLNNERQYNLYPKTFVLACSLARKMIADSKVYVQFIKTLSDLHPEDSVMQLINKTLGSTSKDIDIWRESIHDFGTLIEEVFGGTI